MKTSAPMIWPDCEGRGTVPAFVDTTAGGYFDPALRCLRCKGERTVDPVTVEWMKIGRDHMTARIAHDESIQDHGAIHRCGARALCRRPEDQG